MFVMTTDGVISKGLHTVFEAAPKMRIDRMVNLADCKARLQEQIDGWQEVAAEEGLSLSEINGGLVFGMLLDMGSVIGLQEADVLDMMGYKGPEFTGVE